MKATQAILIVVTLLLIVFDATDVYCDTESKRKITTEYFFLKWILNDKCAKYPPTHTPSTKASSVNYVYILFINYNS